MRGLEHPLAWWLAHDIVLELGQIGSIIDLGWFKIGDGNNPFSGLPLQGLNNINVWFSYYFPIENKGTALTTLINQTLIGGTLVQEGGWVDFNYIILPKNNANAKTVYIKFANQSILSLSVPISNADPIIISGSVKVSDYTGGKAIYRITVLSNGVQQMLIGSLTGLNWNANNTLLLQAQAVATADVILENAEGKICIVSRF